MSRSYVQRQAVLDEAARQRGLALQAPARVETEIVLPNPALLGTRAERDAFADRMLREERRNVAAAQNDEIKSEGRIVRSKPDPKGET